MISRPTASIGVLAATLVLAIVGGGGAPAAAQQTPPTASVTIDAPADTATHHLVITGAQNGLAGIGVRTVAVTLTPQGLPEACGGAITVSGPVERGRYRVEADVPCNGPHVVRAIGRNAFGDQGQASTRTVGVAEPPAPPAAPTTDPTSTSISWPAAGPDSAGWVLEAGSEVRDLAAEVTSVPAAADRSYRLRSTRWGAEGPTSERLVSDWSAAVVTPADEADGGERPSAGSPPPAPPSGSAGAVARPGGRGGATPPGRRDAASPPTSAAGRPTPSPSSSLPEGYDEELPYGDPAPTAAPARPTATAEDEETAAGTPTAAGLVRTREKRSPGLVAPFALGLMLITVAAHIAWYLRRSRPDGDRQVTLL